MFPVFLAEPSFHASVPRTKTRKENTYFEVVRSTSFEIGEQNLERKTLAKFACTVGKKTSSRCVYSVPKRYTIGSAWVSWLSCVPTNGAHDSMKLLHDIKARNPNQRAHAAQVGPCCWPERARLEGRSNIYVALRMSIFSRFGCVKAIAACSDKLYSMWLATNAVIVCDAREGPHARKPRLD